MRKKIWSAIIVLALGAMSLAGCGKSVKTADTGGAGELNIFVWTEYLPDSVVDKFEEETGIKVNVSTYSSNEDMLAKVKSEAAGAYDVLQPSDYMVEQLISQGMLAELDFDQLPNFSHIGESYKNPSYDPGNKYSVPYMGGAGAIVVNKAKVDRDITSYADLFDPSLEGQLVVLDDFRAVIGMTNKALGYDMNETDPEKLAALFEEGAREAGYTGEISDVVLTTIIYSPTTLDTSINEWYKQQLESKLGVQVAISVYPDVTTWKEARDAYQYDFYTMGWFGDYNDPETFMQLFITGGGYAKFFGGFSNERYDELMADAYATQDNNQRLADFIEAENILLEEGGIAPLYYETKQYYAQSYVKGVGYPMFGADFEFSRAYIVKH